jgi:hypothetical protein
MDPDPGGPKTCGSGGSRSYPDPKHWLEGLLTEACSTFDKRSRVKNISNKLNLLPKATYFKIVFLTKAVTDEL